MRRGSITVFLALMLSILVALVGSAFESARTACARVHILNGADVGLYSLFAQYDRELLEAYEIFGLHPAAPSGAVPAAQAYEIFLEYMEPLLAVRGISMETGVGGISGYTLLTDQNGQSFWKQAVQTEKQALGHQGIEWLSKTVQERAQAAEEQEDTWKNAEEGEAFTEYDQAIQQAAEEEQAWEESLEEESSLEEGLDPGGGLTAEDGLVPVEPERVDNPIQTIRELMDLGILQLVLENPQEVSWASVDRSSFLSERTKAEGFAMGMLQEEMSAADRLLFQRYLLDRMGNYRREGQGLMKYQMEYILCGKNSDGENLKAAANRLLLIREGLNLAYLLSDPQKRAEAAAMAAAIASSFLFPPAAGIIEKALLICWSFGESVLDLRALFGGGKIGLWKKADTWRLSLENLMQLPQLLESAGQGEEEGLEYEDYLQILLFMKTENSQVMRAMDQAELELRARKGNGEFRLDHCISALEVSVDVEVSGRKFTVTRQYGY